LQRLDVAFNAFNLSPYGKVHEQCDTDARAAACDRVDQLQVFQELIKELEREEAEQKRTQQEARLRQERKHREAWGCAAVHRIHTPSTSQPDTALHLSTSPPLRLSTLVHQST